MPQTVTASLIKIITVLHEPDGYIDLILYNPSIAKNAGPGQFVMMKAAPVNDPILPRPFDIVDTFPREGTFRLLIKINGRGTALMNSLKPGDDVFITGPLGKPITDFSFSSCAVLFRGCGAAAVLMFIREAKKRGITVYGIASAASSDKLVCKSEISALCDEYLVATDDGSLGLQALGTEVLKNIVEGEGVDRIYSCGGGPFYLPYLMEVQDRLPVYLFLESYMGCGVGHCHGCAVPKKSRPGDPVQYTLVCQEGPLYKLDEVEDPCQIYQ
ncbi:MAG: hypothetical protein JW904_07400 [Spirochaetales bacterium]|nr:hypothetical protein [Spirochaetales bacterium]